MDGKIHKSSTHGNFVVNISTFYKLKNEHVCKKPCSHAIFVCVFTNRNYKFGFKLASVNRFILMKTSLNSQSLRILVK